MRALHREAGRASDEDGGEDAADVDAALVDMEESVASLCQQIILQRHMLPEGGVEDERKGEDDGEGKNRLQQPREDEDGSSRSGALFDQQWLVESTAFSATPHQSPPRLDHHHHQRPSRGLRLFTLSAGARTCIDSAVGQADRVAARVQEQLVGSEDSNIGG